MTIEIVGIGGSMDPGSQSERALRAVLAACATRGASTSAFTGRSLEMPPYVPGATVPTAALAPVEAIRRSAAVVIASPGYHGTVSGLVKNALDYAEDLRTDVRPYFSGRAVGCIATAGGWPGAINTLGALRDIVHALRGWPTPLGAAINSAENAFDEAGRCLVPRVGQVLDLMAEEVMGFARSAAPR